MQIVKAKVKKPGFPSLELRRLHLDLMCYYKVVFGLAKLYFADFCEFSLYHARGRAY